MLNFFKKEHEILTGNDKLLLVLNGLDEIPSRYMIISILNKGGHFMSLINICEINTYYGYKSIELHHADLSAFNKSVDCLIISAFKGDYIPTPNSLIGALHENLNINIDDVVKDLQIDLRESLNVWLSK